MEDPVLKRKGLTISLGVWDWDNSEKAKNFMQEFVGAAV